MATIKPFKAIRPTKNLAQRVAALPYDVMTSQEARELVKDNKYSFLHVDKAEIDLPSEIDLYDDKVYAKAKENLDKMISENVLIQDEKPCLYIYKLKMNSRTQTGLVVCTSIDEYLNNTIKKHELTREDKEQDRIKHVDICDANTGPIFLAYREKLEISEIINSYCENNLPEYDFVCEDDVEHTVWVINSCEIIDKLVLLFGGVSNFYIADGHHRNASAVKVGLKRRAENPDKNAEFNYYLSVLFPDTQLYIMDYNRSVKDLNGLTRKQFLDKISENFEIEVCEEKTSFKPSEPHTFGMYLNNKWYKLSAKKQIISEDPVGSLDVSILQENILNPILGIKDPRTDKRIDFIGGIRGISQLEKLVNNNTCKVSFSMFPTSLKELFDIADANELMPPKSTWFEPKLRSGLFVHSLSK